MDFDEFKSKLKEASYNSNFVFEEEFFIQKYFVSKNDTPDFFYNDYYDKLKILKQQFKHKLFFSLDGGSSIIFNDSSKLLGLVKIVLLYFNPVTFKKKIFLYTFFLDVKVEKENFVISLKKVYDNKTSSNFFKSSYENFDVKLFTNVFEKINAIDNVVFETPVYSTSLRENNNIVVLKNIVDTVDIARSFLEKLFLRDFLKYSSNSDVVDFVFFYDGSLKENFFEEKSIVEDIKNLQYNNNFLLLGFCKTSNLLSENFSPEQKLSFKFKDYKVWFYNLKFKNDNLNDNFKDDFFVSFSKLHPKSNFVFRIDSFKNDFKNIFDFLILNSYDAAFFGYPYILILNDKFARISNAENSRFKVLLSSYFNKDFLKKSPHNVLDTLEF